MTNILDVIVKSDLGEKPFKEYVHAILIKLFEDQDGFSGKRPFGNSGFYFDIGKSFCEAGLIPDAKLSEYRYEDGEVERDWSYDYHYVISLIEEGLNQALNIKK